MNLPSLRTGLHSWSYRKLLDSGELDVYGFLDDAARIGFKDIELMTGQAGTVSPHIGSEDLPNLKKIVEYAHSKDLRIHTLSTYNDFSITIAEDWRQANIRYILEWISKAAALKVPNLRFLTGYIYDKDPLEKLEQLVIEATKRCAAKAEEFGINLALENHSSVFLYADEILSLIEETGSSRLTTCPDPTNGFNISQESDPQELERMYENLRRLAPKATCAHLKIFGIEHGKLIGYDLDRVISIFLDSGYNGPIMFETTDEDFESEIIAEAKSIVDRSIQRLSALA
ncbi:sugar phosphate isomerase/epimerase family protein [Pelagicoccus mobilis]|uniref:Sugar phosphate isomerase/epimerase n=1 Tax=Pelagicoccus mobilis TaxID=415221 RepID=A0A934VRN5_9BACT|nr:sugar phosphate isomerase/epimerase family protein [Pelagicoccus mobilis]MBK1877669.1 sugar phosphate isomerase/epimerase [Pelagicoccus mobilis]